MSAIAWAAIMKAIQNWVVAASGLNSNFVLWTYYGAARPQLVASDPTKSAFIELTFGDVATLAHDWVTYDDNPLAFAELTVAGVVGNVLEIDNHNLVTGDGPIQMSSSGTLPAPLLPGTDYWVIVVDANHVELSATFVGTGGNYPGNPVTPITLTSAGSGTIQLSSTEDTVRAGIELVRTAQGPREITMQMQCFGIEKSGVLALQLMTDVVTSIPLHLDALDAAGVGLSDLDAAFSQSGVKFIEGHRGGILEPRALLEFTIYVTASLSDFFTYIAEIKANVQAQNAAGTTLATIPLDVTAGS